MDKVESITSVKSVVATSDSLAETMIRADRAISLSLAARIQRSAESEKPIFYAALATAKAHSLQASSVVTYSLIDTPIERSL